MRAVCARMRGFVRMCALLHMCACAYMRVLCACEYVLMCAYICVCYVWCGVLRVLRVCRVYRECGDGIPAQLNYSRKNAGRSITSSSLFFPSPSPLPPSIFPLHTLKKIPHFVT